MIVLKETTTYESVFHLTIGGNHEKPGYRIPAMWIIGQAYYIEFNPETPRSGIRRNLQLNQEINVKIAQALIAGKPTVRIFIDQNRVHEESHNWKTPFTNVKFYLGDPWYEPAPVKISNLKYKNI